MKKKFDLLRCPNPAEARFNLLQNWAVAFRTSPTKQASWPL
jgi:hypothetical protein